MIDRYERAWVEVNLDAVKQNINNLKALIKEETKICAVIKADGYGLGAAPIARSIQTMVDFFATASLDEAVNLRDNGTKLPILVLGYTDGSRVSDAIDNDVRLTLYDIETAEVFNAEASRLGKKIKVHLKVDTGMSRIGVPCNSDGIALAKKINEFNNIEIEGIYTHFFNADAVDDSDTEKQFDKFTWFCDEVKKEGLNIPIRHCSNSAAATRLKKCNLEMVRLGISMYGLYPSDNVKSVKLIPALSFKSHVTMVKTIEAGTSVSYGARFVAEKPTKIATVSVGYADGYNRRLSCLADVLVNGKRAKITGSVCMDQIMVDVSDLDDVKQGDEVVLVGKQGNEEVTLEELAGIVGTINYELSCLITRRVPRYYFENGEMTLEKDWFSDVYVK